MKLFALETPDGELASQNLKVLVHENRAELEFLFPTTKVVEVNPRALAGRPTLPIALARGMETVRFPLRRADFPR